MVLLMRTKPYTSRENAGMDVFSHGISVPSCYVSSHIASILRAETCNQIFYPGEKGLGV